MPVLPALVHAGGPECLPPVLLLKTSLPTGPATPQPAPGLSLFHASYPNVCALTRPALTTADRTALSNGSCTKLILVTNTPTDTFLKSLPRSVQCAIKRTPEDLNRILVESGPEALAQQIDQLPEKELTNPNRPLSLTPESGDSFSVVFGNRCYAIRGLEKGKRRLKATVRVEHPGNPGKRGTSLHVDTLDFYSARARNSLSKDLARLFSESAVTVESDIAKLIAACEAYEGTGTDEGEPALTISEPDRREAEAFGKSPDLLEQVVTDFETWGLVGENANKLLCYLAAVSRKAQEPLSVLILSSSGAGKSTLQDAALAFCPPEDVIKLTSLSGKALFYKGRTSLKHKILALEEGIGAEVQARLAETLEYVKEPKVLPGSTLAHQQMKKLLTAVDTASGEGYRNRTMLELLYSTGIRASELLSLNMDSVDYRNRTALVHGKGKKERIVPIGRTALHHLETYVKAVRPYLVSEESGSAVFLDKRGRRVLYWVLRRMLGRYAKKAGIDINVTAHTFRRACATEMLRAGAGMYHVKELLGHESLDTIKHYAKLTITDLKETHRKCHPRERDEDEDR